MNMNPRIELRRRQRVVKRRLHAVATDVHAAAIETLAESVRLDANGQASVLGILASAERTLRELVRDMREAKAHVLASAEVEPAGNGGA